MKSIHGGDIYRNRVSVDFSVNMNPLGVPEKVIEALHNAVSKCQAYPDPECMALRTAIGSRWSVDPEKVLIGNGASELFLAIVHGIAPKNVLIPIPSFYGYLHAANAVNAHVHVCSQSVESILASLTEEIDLLFLTNPNNPTGELKRKQEVETIVERCKEQGILVVLDECFIEFCEEDATLVDALDSYPNVILLRAFTKLYSIPGVRLGYAICQDAMLVETIRKQLPEWNVSTFAQEAGIACLKETEFVRQTAAYVRAERDVLTRGLQEYGVHVFPSAANFLLCQTELPLYEQLLSKGILIRDCANYDGLGAGYYRIAVKKQEDNERLLQTIGECLWKKEESNS